MCLQLSDKGAWVTGYGEHGSKNSLWLKNNASAYPAVSSSEAKDRWCAFETQSVSMIILLTFLLVFKFTSQVFEKQF